MSAIAVPLVRPSVPADPVTPDDLLKMEDQGLFELVVYPDSRIIRVHRVGTQSIDELRDGDLLTGDALLPSFEAKVTELMPAKFDDPAQASA